MSNIFNQDFREFIRALNDAQVSYLLVGGYAVILHGRSRTTGDMDVWVQPSAENFLRLMKAFTAIGLPAISEEAFLTPDEMDVFSFGRPPVAIDIMTRVKGLSFEECFAASTLFFDGDLEIRTVMLGHLIAAKRAAGRHKDLDDLEHLTS